MTLEELMARREMQGYEAGLERLNALYLRLKEEGRMEDVIRAMEDESFRMELLNRESVY